MTTREHDDIPASLRDEFNDLAGGVYVAGGFYELHAQKLSDVVDDWIKGQPDDGSRGLAQKLAQQHPDYVPERTGRWVYSGEDNDVFFVEDKTRPAPRVSTTSVPHVPS